MKIVLESMPSAEEPGEQELVMRNLQRLGLLQSGQRLSDGAWLVEMDDALIADLAKRVGLLSDPC